MTDRATLLAQLAADRALAHRWFFPHRHRDTDPPYFRDALSLLYGPDEYAQLCVFRGGSKSTVAVERVVLGVGFREFRYCVIIRASEPRGMETLAAVKRELTMNARFSGLFGDQKGALWQDGVILTTNARMVQVLGKGQGLRGLNHPNDSSRPDFILIDDFEDRENVDTPAGREAMMSWVLSELLPVCEPERKVRVLYTPMDPDSTPELFRKNSGWPTMRVPIESVGDKGKRAAAWPERYPLSWIDRERAVYESQGKLRIWEQEYMLEAQPLTGRTFLPSDIKIEPRVRTWEAVHCMIDPARTVGAKSDFTGIAAWSWVQNRLVVWECSEKKLLPDEIITECFRLGDTYAPIWIGIERDGLEQWLAQPIRQMQRQRGSALPIFSVRAPRGQTELIVLGLQPFFRAGEVVWTSDLPDLRRELLSFPSGKRDALNALAYAPIMKPGLPVYEEFSQSLIVEEPYYETWRAPWLAMNHQGTWLTGVLCSIIDSRLTIVADFVREGDADEAFDMVADAQLESGRGVRVGLGAEHWQAWAPSPLAGALRRGGVPTTRTADVDRGRSWLRRSLQRTHRGMPVVQIAASARWTINAFAGGYARKLGAAGLSPEAEPGPYRTLMEGLESLLGLIEARAQIDEEDDSENYRYTPDGRRYKSLLKDR